VGTLQFESVENIRSKEEVNIGFMCWNENEWSTFLYIMIGKLLEKSFVDNYFLKYLFKYFV